MAEFARQALKLRGVPEKVAAKGNAEYLAKSLLAARRYEDRGQNLWEVFNRVQENIIRGVRGTRRITSAARDTELNKGL